MALIVPHLSTDQNADQITDQSNPLYLCSRRLLFSPAVFLLICSATITTLVSSKGCKLLLRKRLEFRPISKRLSLMPIGAKCDWRSLMSLACRCSRHRPRVTHQQQFLSQMLRLSCLRVAPHCLTLCRFI